MHTHKIRPVASALLVLCLAVASSPLTAQAQDKPAEPYQPQIGQLGKDVVWVPTPERLIVRMLQMADTTRRDTVVDLGSGDGRIPIAAAKIFGARAIGVEFDPKLVQYSIRAAERAGVSGRVRFFEQDMFKFDLSVATVVALYVSPDLMSRLRPILLGLKPGTRVVSHQFTLGDWEPDEMARVENTPGYLWVVPVSAGGTWILGVGEENYRLRFEQEHQMLRGTAESGGKGSPVIAARVRGEQIRFALVDREGYSRAFTGTVAGGSMQGDSRSYERPDLRWRARRE